MSLVPRQRAGVGATLIACLSLLVATPAAAQPNISQDTATASAPLTTAQVGQIDNFIGYWLQQLVQAQTTSGISAARNQIIGQITLPGSSDAFRNQYVQSLVNQVGPMLNGQPLVVRLNCMIILSRTQQRGVLGLAQTALQDPSSAIRYWAAKTIEEVLANQGSNAPPLPNQLRTGLLAALQQAAQSERQPATLAQIFSAMAALGEVSRVIQSLDNRLASHVDDPEALLLPERRAMEQLYIQLVRSIAQQGLGAVEQEIRELSRVALLYLTISSTQLAEAEAMGADLIDDKRAMVEQADLILRWSVQQLGQAGVVPPPIRNAVQTRDWGAIVAQLDFWRRELTGSPFLFQPSDLELPQPGDAE